MHQNLIQSNIPVIQPLDLRKELYGFSGSAKALLFFDDLGVDSNDNVEVSSGARPNQWLHLQHKDFWLEDELTAYKRRLLAEKELNNYEYVAFLTNGQKCRFNVNARLATYRNDLIRIVKVNSCIPV